jgi:Mn-dependent DtxR family transcriptional regulator
MNAVDEALSGAARVGREPPGRVGITVRQSECRRAVLELMAKSDGASPSTTEVAARLGISPPSAMRLMRGLCNRGWARWPRYGRRAFYLVD